MWSELKKGRYSQENGEYFITFNCLNRSTLFYNDQFAKIFCQQISKNENKQHCQWLTWVLMPNHFHGLLQLGDIYPLPIKIHLSVASSYTKTRRDMMTMASPYRMLQRSIGVRASDPEGKP